jgi:hypothetical protein
LWEQQELFVMFLFCEKWYILWNGKENEFSFEDVSMVQENVVKMWDLIFIYFLA